MGLAMLMVGADDSTTMTNIGRSLSRSSSPSIDVAVRHSLCDGTQNDTLSKHCLAVVVEYGVEPWVPEGVDHVFISYVGPWYRGRRVDRRISEVGFSCSSILEYGGEGVKRTGNYRYPVLLASSHSPGSSLSSMAAQKVRY
jgi:hypothetical protein